MYTEISNFFIKLGYAIEPPGPLYSPEYSKKNNFYCYSVDDLLLLSSKKDKPNSDKFIVFQPCSRVEDFCSLNKFQLQKFSMLAVCGTSFFKDSMDFLRDVCKADFKRIGVVSISKTNQFSGVEKFKPVFLEYGIPEENILVRSLDEAVYTRDGNGLWSSPSFPLQLYFSISFYYKRKTDCPVSISQYENTEEWLEFAELVEHKHKHSFFTTGTGTGIGFGLERLQYLFLNIPYPKANRNSIKCDFTDSTTNKDYIEILNENL